jgi:hypothetical protein
LTSSLHGSLPQLAPLSKQVKALFVHWLLYYSLAHYRAEVVDFFKISHATLTIWLRNRRENGDVRSIKRGRYKTIKLEYSLVLEYIKHSAGIDYEEWQCMNMVITRCKLTRKVQVHLLQFFVAGVTARTAAELIGVSRPTSTL